MNRPPFWIWILGWLDKCSADLQIGRRAVQALDGSPALQQALVR